MCGRIDIDRELAAVFEPVQRDPHDVTALRVLVEVLHEQFGTDSDEGEAIDVIREQLARGGCLEEFDREFIIYTTRLALRLPERLLT